jgi:4-hydroxy-3-methylbut-2-enyl diphosphate reductase IspH
MFNVFLNFRIVAGGQNSSNSDHEVGKNQSEQSQSYNITKSIAIERNYSIHVYPVSVTVLREYSSSCRLHHGGNSTSTKR